MEIALVKAKTRIVFFILVVPSVLFLFRQLGAPEKEKGANLIAPSLRHREAPCRECAKPRRCGARFGSRQSKIRGFQGDPQPKLRRLDFLKGFLHNFSESRDIIAGNIANDKEILQRLRKACPSQSFRSADFSPLQY